MPLHSLVEELGCDGCLSSFLLQEGVKLSKIIACSLEIAPIIRMDVGRKSSSGDEPSETGKESFSGSIRYHFQMCSLCAKAHEHSKISFYYGGLTGVSSFDQEGSGVVDPTHGEWGLGVTVVVGSWPIICCSVWAVALRQMTQLLQIA